MKAAPALVALGILGVALSCLPSVAASGDSLPVYVDPSYDGSRLCLHRTYEPTSSSWSGRLACTPAGTDCPPDNPLCD